VKQEIPPHIFKDSRGED